SRSSSRLNSETPFAKADGVLFWAVENPVTTHQSHNTKRPQRNSSQKRLISMPFGNSMQSVSAFLVWCSTFSQGLIFYPQDAASTFFNEML
ncbi:hypothetical protein, partial [Pseudomonas sp. DWP3-1-3b3]|uniref:hypothetical protein n=1 Tax=Pseudomonas sp. DWP3-1-3b3 TaxID=2804644 RepID=UPI003CE7CD3F